MTANAPDTPMKRDGGLMSMLFVAKAVNLHTFNADYPDGGMADDLWAYATLDRVNNSIAHDENPIAAGDAIFFERGGFEPVFIQNAETFLREYLKDETSTIVVPGE